MNHSFDIDIAIKYGVPQAIIINNMLFWLAHNKAFGINIHNGKVWTFNSVAAYAELFPYWTVDQIRRYFESLEADGFLEAGNFNKKKYDKTKWHTVTDQALIPHWQISQRRKSQKDLAEMPEAIGGNAKPIPDINQSKTKCKQIASSTDSAEPLLNPNSKETVKNQENISILPSFKIREVRNKNKTVKVERYPEIRSLLETLAEYDLKKFSDNTKRLMRNAVTDHGEDFCLAAIRGRFIEMKLKGTDKDYIPLFFNDDNIEWMERCERLSKSSGQARNGDSRQSSFTDEQSKELEELMSQSVS